MVRPTLYAFVVAALATSLAPGIARASDCDDPAAEWLACEDFEQGGLGWQEWFAQSPFVECRGCSEGTNNPDRILLDNNPANAFDGDWSVYLPAAQSAQFQGAELAFRSCAGEKQQGCPLENHDRLYFRTRVKLAEDHQYVHHFLSIGGTRPDGYWEGMGNAGCRPNGSRHMGTTVDFNTDNELFFYSYHPEMGCDSGGYCSGDYAQGICDGCAERDMPCENGPECCWGNHFSPEPAVVLPRGEWVCLEMMIEVNTPGQNDGVMAFWMDDQLAIEVADCVGAMSPSWVSIAPTSGTILKSVTRTRATECGSMTSSSAPSALDVPCRLLPQRPAADPTRERHRAIAARPTRRRVRAAMARPHRKPVTTATRRPGAGRSIPMAARHRRPTRAAAVAAATIKGRAHDDHFGWASCCWGCSAYVGATAPELFCLLAQSTNPTT